MYHLLHALNIPVHVQEVTPPPSPPLPSAP